VTPYILSEDADRDLDDIWDYIAEDNVDAADQWIGRLFDAFDAIGNTPGMGHKREDLTAYPVSVLAGGRLPRHLSRHIPAQ
jgi:toxin ParE1/3/4